MRWSGFQGAPGYSNFFFQGEGTDAQTATARNRVYEMFNQFSGILPNDVEYIIVPDHPVFDEATGTLTGYGNPPNPGTPGTGASAGGYSAASGAVINWLTNTVAGNRRVMGRTFVVPLSGSAYEGNGTLSPSASMTLNDAAGEMIQGGEESGFGIWSRPRNGAGGVFAPVENYRVPDMAAVLRSRRD